MSKRAASLRGENPGGPNSLDQTRAFLPQLITLVEVADVLRVSPKTVRRLVARRAIPCVRIGGLLRFDHRDLAHWISARKGV